MIGTELPRTFLAYSSVTFNAPKDWFGLLGGIMQAQLGSWKKLATWRYLLRMFAAKRAWCFYSIYRKQPDRHVSVAIDVVIEGFPRSANTYAVEAFEQCNPGVRVAHHQHAQIQVLQAAKQSLPTIVLIRHPVDAVRSHMIRIPDLPLRLVIAQYCRFYEDIWSVRKSFILAPFDEVTRDFGGVIAKLNSRWGREYNALADEPNAVERVFDEIDSKNARAFGGQVNPAFLPRPHPERERMKTHLQLSPDDLIWQPALAIYQRFMDWHADNA